jgi:hypothetical protein
MRERTKPFEMLKSMKPGQIYRQAELQQKWPNASHDLGYLVELGEVQKVSAGLYFRPRTTKYGSIAPKDEELVKSFLRDGDFLLLDTNDYTSLVGGLTQLSMGHKVLNKRRHGQFRLAGFHFDFRVRRAFPKRVSKAFLLVDLLDNVEQTEDGTPVKERVLPRLHEYDQDELLQTAKRYGNRRTEQFLRQAFKQ